MGRRKGEWGSGNAEGGEGTTERILADDKWRGQVSAQPPVFDPACLSEKETKVLKIQNLQHRIIYPFKMFLMG